MKNLTLFLMLAGVSQVIVAQKSEEILTSPGFLTHFYNKFIKSKEQDEQTKEQAHLQEEAEKIAKKRLDLKEEKEKIEEAQSDLLKQGANLAEKRCGMLPKSLTLTTRLMEERECKDYLVDEFGRINEEHKKLIEQSSKHLPSSPSDTPLYKNAKFIYHRPDWGWGDEKPYYFNLMKLLESKKFINEYNQFNTSGDEKHATAMEEMINDVRWR